MQTNVLEQYLAECRDLVVSEIREIVPDNRFRPILYDLILDYPLRLGKAFRPSLCIATCRALGGRLQDVIHTAAVLELLHNAFLVHDDIEDGSLLRRGSPTLHQQYGMPIAVNVGDGAFVLTLQPLLDNMRLLGMTKALQILQIISQMTRESVEGQAIELDWVRRGDWNLRDRDYCLMCFKKTCWYTFIAPMWIGGVITGLSPAQMALLRRYASYVGVAFQIQDDVLNLIADEGRYGKEIGGDLWEGKHTLILLHMMRSATPDERELAHRILNKPREEKQPEDIQPLFELVHRYGSIGYAQNVAFTLASKAERLIESAYDWMPASVHRDFIYGMAQHVIQRDK
jgi:geranylgeranyl diphosphate synthase type II